MLINNKLNIFNHKIRNCVAKLLRFFWNPYSVEIPSGNCPVQGEGLLKTGEWYYFRSRGDSWKLYIARSEAHMWSKHSYLYVHKGFFKDPYEGGWISPAKAYILLNKGLKAYYAQTIYF